MYKLIRKKIKIQMIKDKRVINCVLNFKSDSL